MAVSADSHGMTSVSDDVWLARARQRAAGGSWERDADTIFADLRREAEQLRARRPPAPRCPYCVEKPELLVFPRFELLSADPLLFCGVCRGFWAKGDSLARGVADPGFDHPALRTVEAPRRCRACFGHLKPDHTCAKCGEAAPLVRCPECGREMERFEKDGALLDQCPPCRGIWFDMGEIARVYSLKAPQGLAAATVDEHAADGEPAGWLMALGVLGRMVFPFLPL